VAPANYIRHALAAVTTHDLPTLHGWWSGHDIDLWEKLGFYAEKSIGERIRAERQADRERLMRALRREELWAGDVDAVPEFSADLGRAVHVYLGKSPTALVTVQLEDMIGMLEPVNVPGTSVEYSNWTRRMTASAREIFARDDVRALCAAMVASRRT
jgi:4-alpha-glucanotransferase